MTPQEQQMLDDLVQKINGTRLQEKDDDAEEFLSRGLGRNPDAMYMLAQTVLVQNLALQQAKQQIQALQAPPAQPQPAKATSFLGSLLGRRDPDPAPQGSGSYQQVNYGQQQSYTQQPQYSAPQPVYQAPPSGQPSFLRSAATTAAGVAAGALAFEGIESMMHGGSVFGGGGFGGGEYGAPREEIVNNYYDSAPSGGGNDSYVQGPDEQPQGSYGDDSSNFGDDFSNGGGDFGGDDSSWS